MGNKLTPIIATLIFSCNNDGSVKIELSNNSPTDAEPNNAQIAASKLLQYVIKNPDILGYDATEVVKKEMFQEESHDIIPERMTIPGNVARAVIARNSNHSEVLTDDECKVMRKAANFLAGTSVKCSCGVIGCIIALGKKLVEDKVDVSGDTVDITAYYGTVSYKEAHAESLNMFPPATN